MFQWFEGVRSCSETDTLMMVIEVIVRAEVHRLIVTDHEQKVVGIISLSDILRFLVLEPPVALHEGIFCFLKSISSFIYIHY